MLAKVKGVTFKGLQVVDIDIEISVHRGLPIFEIVGLPNKSVEESRYRIRSAFVNSGLEFPDGRIIVNLAPADLNKSGSGFDLGIAVGIYCAKNNILLNENYYFFGELSLDGTVKSTKGDYLAIERVNAISQTIFVAYSTLDYSDNFTKANILPVRNLKDMIHRLKNNCLSRPVSPPNSQEAESWKNPKIENVSSTKLSDAPSITDIIGQDLGKRALEISVAGGHNVMLVGSPGTGKSMLARSVCSILPPLTNDEVKELRRINSYVGADIRSVTKRPFRAPHHTISYAGMLGGGSDPLPGEITYAHKGVLFMDEFCEFPRNVLESLRQPLQEKQITLTRANVTYTFPCDFFLIAASNPCPCGYLGHKTKVCVCSEQKTATYTKKLSGPISDRFDLFVQVYPESEFASKIVNSHTGIKEPNKCRLLEEIRERVQKARKLQLIRLQKYSKNLNANMDNNEILQEVPLDLSCKKLLDKAYDKLGFSPRAYFKIIKVARTIADLEPSEMVVEYHLAEAIQYRQRI